MEEEVQFCIEELKEKMDNSIKHFSDELTKIRAGKATPQMIDNIMIDYYGTLTPLNRISNINTPDPRTIRIQPWEKNMIDIIEKTILNANLGFNPTNNGEAVIINVPILTEERRCDLVKQVKNIGENAKVSIRNARRETNDQLKKMLKDGLSEDMEKGAEEDVQKLTDEYVKKIDELLGEKEKDIMTI
ncbi:MAG: ribosome recycling factor [Bacteroidales bacterium]|nr:ribosome recycling factor [Bacteroidales bacterium]